jgi:hypothetical protein
MEISLSVLLDHAGLGVDEALVQVLREKDLAVDGCHLLVVVSQLLLADLLHVAVLAAHLPKLLLQILVVDTLGSQLVLKLLVLVGESR